MRHRLVVLYFAVLTVFLVNSVGAQELASFGFPDGLARGYLRRAMDGAATRLSRERCHALLDDFTDVSGQLLSTTLAARGRSPVDAFKLLRFYVDRDAPQCRGRVTLAFTQIGSRLIRVCGPRFKHQFLENRENTELILIHEFLHSLGLGENPPSSAAITKQVESRCAS